MKVINTIEQEILERLENGLSKQSRIRSHAILLLNGGKSKNQITEIFDVTNRTVYNWIKEWEKQGINSMYQKREDGRKLILKLCTMTKA